MKLRSIVFLTIITLILVVVVPAIVQAQTESDLKWVADVGADFSLYRVDTNPSVVTWLVLIPNKDPTVVSVKEQGFRAVQNIIPGDSTFSLGLHTARIVKVELGDLQPDVYCLIVTGSVPVFNCK